MKRIIVLCSVVLLLINFVNAQDIDQKYPFVTGNLRFSKNFSIFSNIKNTEISSDTILVFNKWDKEMTLEFTDVKHIPHLNVQAFPAKLAPGSSGIIVIRVDGPKVNSFGVNNLSLGVYTNDADQAVKRITVSINLIEDFSKLTPQQKLNAPKISFNTTKYDFGTVTAGNPVKYSFELKNTGKSELIIRRTAASCGCTATNPAKLNLQPGEATTIDINFNTSGRNGRQIKTVTVISNDPETPSITLIIEGNLQ
jgi:hypothetical protein